MSPDTPPSPHPPLPALHAGAGVAFPFTALQGQPELQRALLLVAVDPGIGGVLISGPRGTAKSTAARALAALLPQAPFVTLPLAASLEQLVGTLDLQDALRHGSVRLAPGLLARAHGGVLYVDEVNLLPDALVDAVLDAAASGINTVERDGLSRQHAARFVLVGTINPEEGELRPQLLDRFGLGVQLRNPHDAALRQAILRTRLVFERDPHALLQQHAAALAQQAQQVQAARAALSALDWSDAVLARAAALALRAGVDGVRADLVMLRAARALAALEQRAQVTPADVDAVAALALTHRMAPPEGGAAAAPPAGHDGHAGHAGHTGNAGHAGLTGNAGNAGSAGLTDDAAHAGRAGHAGPAVRAAAAGDTGHPDHRGDAGHQGYRGHAGHAGPGEPVNGGAREGNWGALPAQPVGLLQPRAPWELRAKKA